MRGGDGAYFKAGSTHELHPFQDQGHDFTQVPKALPLRIEFKGLGDHSRGMASPDFPVRQTRQARKIAALLAEIGKDGKIPGIEDVPGSPEVGGLKVELETGAHGIELNTGIRSLPAFHQIRRMEREIKGLRLEHAS